MTVERQIHKIISVDAENAFGELPHYFMLKTLNKTRIEETNLNIIKAICNKPKLTLY
jgi:hypothetical protein